MLEMELPGRRRRGRPKKRFMDAVREDMQVVSGRYREQVVIENNDSLWQHHDKRQAERKRRRHNFHTVLF